MAGVMSLTVGQRTELEAMISSPEMSAEVATRARIVLWHDEGRMKKDVALLAGVSRPTVDAWLARHEAEGAAGLLGHKRGAPREQVPARVRARALALSRAKPPHETGLSHWSSRELAAYLEQAEGVRVSFGWVARLWRDSGLKPHRQGTFKLSKDRSRVR